MDNPSFAIIFTLLVTVVIAFGIRSQIDLVREVKRARARGETRVVMLGTKGGVRFSIRGAYLQVYVFAPTTFLALVAMVVGYWWLLFRS